MDSIWLKLEYEGLNLICFNCGVYGHNKEECGKEKEDNTSAAVINKEMQEPLPFGPWLQVTSNYRGRKANTKEGVGKKAQRKGQPTVSCFNILAGSDTEPQIDDVVERNSKFPRLTFRPIDKVPRVIAINKCNKKDKGKDIASENATVIKGNTGNDHFSNMVHVTSVGKGKRTMITNHVTDVVKNKESKVSRYTEAFSKIVWEDEEARDDMESSNVACRISPDPGDDKLSLDVSVVNETLKENHMDVLENVDDMVVDLPKVNY